MKRNHDEMDVSENAMASAENVEDQVLKKIRENETDSNRTLQVMEYQDGPSNFRENMEFFNSLQGYGNLSLVEREPNPLGYNLVNPEYIGKKSHQELTELKAGFSKAANFTEANAKNKIEMIGQQMKYLQETLHKVIQDTKRDSELHAIACNFVKKPGHTYHLYERPSGQKYFSMLSPQDWSGNSPHKFLGSWFLESDESWVPAEELHLRHPGLNFLRELYMGKKSIQ